MCSKLTPRARIPDTRIPQLMQPGFRWCYNLKNDWQQPHLGIVKDEQKVYDGKIVEHRGIGSQFQLPYTLRQINCGGLLLAPGLIDLQVQCAHCHKTSSIRTFLEFPNVKSKSRWHFMDNKHMLETVVTWLCSPPQFWAPPISKGKRHSRQKLWPQPDKRNFVPCILPCKIGGTQNLGHLTLAFLFCPKGTRICSLTDISILDQWRLWRRFH